MKEHNYFIRTKDTEFRIGEILKVLQEDEDYYECEGTFEKRMGCKAYVKKEIVVKSADTIEELCDEFVGVDVETKTVCISGSYSELDKVKAEMNKYDFQLGKDYEIYGAIWTGKGLIYVAKMNERGELELL